MFENLIQNLRKNPTESARVEMEIMLQHTWMKPTPPSSERI